MTSTSTEECISALAVSSCKQVLPSHRGIFAGRPPVDILDVLFWCGFLIKYSGTLG